MSRRAPPLLGYVSAPGGHAFGIQRQPLLELLQGLEFRVPSTLGLLRRDLDRSPQRAGLGCLPQCGQMLEPLDGVQVQRIC